ncbi:MULTISPECIES: DMT family transporter [unclassified Aminobacter]|uniref:DMT family transporter n=1 Tax=unclassified Aminobacter TaxID=2644704 RepID=UPI000462F1C0|nr:MULTISPECIES: DMT family transporter [unclassified Aminobacter]TWG53197.1 drug/metabolite transporter (DMT)-like permease [Aminobacter sp. J44]TWH25500.1 drug/metabolite transporter (DMT)-like permease [Aminobacter sp. J15]
MPLSPNTRSAIFMIVAMAGFTISDAISKYVIGPMNVGQLLFVRGCAATLLIGLLTWHQGFFRNWKQLLHMSVLWRGIGEVGATMTFMAALSHMPLANVHAIMQALPLAVTMGAALFLGEMVGWRRWLAIAAGFTGVMIVVRPGMEGFNAYSVLTLISVSFCAVRDLATSRIPREVPSMLVSTLTAAIVTIAGAVIIVPLGGWRPMSGFHFSIIMSAAVVLLFGYQFLIMSMREGNVSFVAPFRYTALLWAIALGFIVFGDIPDAVTLTGAAIIIASGIYTLYRERKVGKKKMAAQSTGPSMAPDGL